MTLDGEAFRGPDPKPTSGKRTPIRKVSSLASKRATVGKECVACGHAAANAHHVVPKGSPHFGDDVDENLAPLCGSGSARCHGAFHGSPYVDATGRRWTKKDVAKGIAGWILTDPKRLEYALAKAGADYLRRVYDIREVTWPQ